VLRDPVLFLTFLEGFLPLLFYFFDSSDLVYKVSSLETIDYEFLFLVDNETFLSLLKFFSDGAMLRADLFRLADFD
jgi:hypothetical protein